MSNSKLNVLMIGKDVSTGTENSRIQRFKPEWQDGEGMSYQWPNINPEHPWDILDGGKVYHNVPDFANPNARHDAGKAIEKALKHNGRYKLIFVLRQKKGRIVADDVATIRTVLTACRVVGSDYGVIINNVPLKASEEEVMRHNKEILATLFPRVQGKKKDFPQTLCVHVNTADKDVIKLKDFLLQVPEIVIRPDHVRKLDLGSFDVMRDKYQAQVAELHASKEKMQKKIDDQAKVFGFEIDAFWYSMSLLQRGVCHKDYMKILHEGKSDSVESHEIDESWKSTASLAFPFQDQFLGFGDNGLGEILVNPNFVPYETPVFKFLLA